MARRRSSRVLVCMLVLHPAREAADKQQADIRNKKQMNRNVDDKWNGARSHAKTERQKLKAYRQTDKQTDSVGVATQHKGTGYSRRTDTPVKLVHVQIHTVYTKTQTAHKDIDLQRT